LTSQVIGKSFRKGLLDRSGYRYEDSITVDLGKGWYKGVNCLFFRIRFSRGFDEHCNEDCVP